MITVLLTLGGGLGASARYAADHALRPRIGPWGIAAINLVGSFLLGWCAAAASDDVRAVLGTGFLGGFTTFSTASLETLRLAEERRTATTLAYGLGVLVACVTAAWLGWLVA